MTQSRQLTRRAFVSGTTTGSLVVFARSLRAGDYTFAQYHNQTTDSPLHLRLVEMWTAIRNETGGRVQTTIFPENNKIPGSRQIGGTKRPIKVANDLIGIRMRIPAGQMFEDMFRALG